MLIQGAKTGDEYLYIKLKGVDIRLKRLPLYIWKAIEDKILMPPEPIIIEVDKEGRQRQKPDIREMPRYENEVKKINLIRVAALFYFSVDDNKIQFNVKPVNVEQITKEWAEKIYSEMLEYFNLNEFTLIENKLLESLGASEQEVEAAKQDFLAQQG